MARQTNRKKTKKGADLRPAKKKTSVLTLESVEWVDYKDVNVLRRFMSERAKIRARRVTGNDRQQQQAVSKAIKVAREMALLPYSVRQVTQRKGGRRGDRRRDRPEEGTELAADVTGAPEDLGGEEFGEPTEGFEVEGTGADTAADAATESTGGAAAPADVEADDTAEA
jgi:small subunit ribosomal protein S18